MRSAVLFVSFALLFSGLAIGEGTETSRIKRTVVFAMDSVNAISFRYAIDNGYCPNIEWLIDHGAYYENGVSVFPSVSLSSDFSILTGAYPGNHGILGWMWYNRSDDRFYSVDGAKIWDPVELQKMVDAKDWMSNSTETMFEVVEGEGNAYTSALGTYAAKGADTSVFESSILKIPAALFSRSPGSESTEGPAQSSIDTIAKGDSVELYTTDTGEITNNFLLHQIKRLLFGGVIDSLLFLTMLLDVVRSKSYERSLVYLWISGTDANGHLMGGRSESMLHSYQIVDAKIGIVMSLVKILGMEDETLFVIAGNHGIKGINEKLFERIGYRDMPGIYAPILASGLAYVPGNRGIYLPDATCEQVDSLAREIVRDRWVDFTMYKRNSTITVLSDYGVGEIDVKDSEEKVAERSYDYRVVEGKDPLALGDTLAYSPFYGFQPEDLNIKGPTPIQYPLAIERIIGLFCSPNAPDLVVTIGGEASGQHGDLGYEESVVPIVFSGPGIKKIRSDEPVSIVDIAPTVTKAMGLREPRGCDGTALDVFGQDNSYSLPILHRFYLPLYLPMPRFGLSLLVTLSVSLAVRDLLRLIPRVRRIASIGYIRSLLPEPPEYIGTYDSDIFRTFIL
jgi:predicted AlkP superfamily pyrophosphatase or phosphodiesterase